MSGKVKSYTPLLEFSVIKCTIAVLVFDFEQPVAIQYCIYT